MDITGFNEQIGVSFMPKIALSKLKSMPQMANKTMAPIVKKTIAPIVKKPISPIAKAIDKVKLNTALLKAKQTGNSVIIKTPTGAKKFTPKAVTPFKGLMPQTATPFKALMPKTATPFNLVPTASKSLTPALPTNLPASLPTSLPVEAVKSEIKQMEQSLQSLPAAKQAQAIFDLPPTPAIVENLSPIQQSFLKTDLPYQVISKNNYGQPRTKFIKNTPLKFNIDIDQIQPPVDSGISNYYGK
jgi:hypothetical protein